MSSHIISWQKLDTVPDTNIYGPQEKLFKDILMAKLLVHFMF